MRPDDRVPLRSLQPVVTGMCRVKNDPAHALFSDQLHRRIG